MNFSTADLFDDFEDQLQSCELSFQNFGGIKSFFGQISTIRCHEDNSQTQGQFFGPCGSCIKYCPKTKTKSAGIHFSPFTDTDYTDDRTMGINLFMLWHLSPHRLERMDFRPERVDFRFGDGFQA